MTNFWQALEMVDMSQPEVETEYRLYYNPETGDPLFYTSSDEPGTYIVVDKKAYDIGNYNVKVENKILINLNYIKGYKKLVPADSGKPCHPSNVMLIDYTSNTHWKLKNYAN
jgi:hypothetical protein